MVLKKAPTQTVVSARAVVPRMADVAGYRCDLYEAVYGWLEACGGEQAGPELALYHNGEYAEENVDVEAALPVRGNRASGAAGVEVYELPAVPQMPSATFEGRDIWDIPGTVAARFGENGYASAGPMREIHHFGRELDHEDHASFVVEVL